MYKVFKTAVSQYKVMHTETGEVINTYTTSRFAFSVAALKNSQAAKKVAA